jgi:acetyltransferase-like isoleucine patch superfamily enzyme
MGGKRNLFHTMRMAVRQKVRNVVNPPILDVEELIMGDHVIIEPGVVIHCDRLVIGDGAVIKSGTLIEMTDLVIGDYTKINNNCLLTGSDWCRIGHNCWIGHFTVIDSIGTTRIGDGVGIGAHSQLWTHIYFGDTLEGCRFASHDPLVIEDDVWFVGHCIVSPITARKRSMALVGSVITRDMEENCIYAGVPARDVTEKFGPQFQKSTPQKKHARMEEYLKEFLMTERCSQNRIRIVEKIDPNQEEYSQFSSTERTYSKNLYPEEIRFMRFLLPDKAKFVPIPEEDWVNTYLCDV